MEKKTASNPFNSEQRSISGCQWDFFLSHSGPDSGDAEILYHKLSPSAKVFLDVVTLLPGDNFDVALSEALHSSLISVILISPNTENAYYEQEEIAMAVERTRSDPHTHRVIPVYIKAEMIRSDKIPFGLKRKHSIYIPQSGDFADSAHKLLQTLNVMKHYELKKDQLVTDQTAAATKITNHRSKTELISGFNEITKFVRPLLYTLLGLFVLMLGLLVASIFISSDIRTLLITVSASLCALLLACIFGLISRSLSYVPQIVAGNINGG